MVLKIFLKNYLNKKSESQKSGQKSGLVCSIQYCAGLRRFENITVNKYFGPKYVLIRLLKENVQKPKGNQQKPQENLQKPKENLEQSLQGLSVSHSMFRFLLTFDVLVNSY